MTAVARAIYDVAVAWGKYTGGYFTFDHSLMDGTDVLSPSLLIVPAFSGTYDSLIVPRDPTWPRRVEQMNWFRGRNDTFDQVAAGEATVNVADPHGLLNPKNAGSPIDAYNGDPYRPLRIRAKQHGGSWQGQFYGFLRDLEYHPRGTRGGIATLHAVDLFLRLDPMLTISGLTGTNTGAVIGTCLDAIGWTDPAYRNLATGDTIATWTEGTTGTIPGTTLIGNVLVTEFGLFYVNGAGVATYEDRNARGRKRTPDYTVDDVMRAIAPGSSADRIKNRATFQKTGGVAQTYTDTASADPIRGYGPRPLEPVVSPYIASDDAALSRARYVVSIKKDPVGPVRGLTIDSRTSALLTAILGADISTLFRATEAGTGTSVDGFVERLEHQVDLVGNGRHQATYVLTERAKQIFLFDVSLMDGTDVMPL